MSSVMHQTSSGAVAICGSGHVTLHFGRTMIRLSLEEFQVFLSASAEALLEFGELPTQPSGAASMGLRH